MELVDRAVWSADGEMRFWPEGGHSGRLLPAGSPADQSSIPVRTARLRDYLRGTVDLLKLDIEGAEAEVLLDCADQLDGVERIFVEYHSFIGKEQGIDTLLSVLRSAGFRFHLQPRLAAWNPFMTHLEVHGMDQTVNVYGWREQEPAERSKATDLPAGVDLKPTAASPVVDHAAGAAVSAAVASQDVAAAAY